MDVGFDPPVWDTRRGRPEEVTGSTGGHNAHGHRHDPGRTRTHLRVPAGGGDPRTEADGGTAGPHPRAAGSRRTGSRPRGHRQTVRHAHRGSLRDQGRGGGPANPSLASGLQAALRADPPGRQHPPGRDLRPLRK